MARPRKFEEEKVKNALRDVFWEHGFDGASYSNIMSATGLNKGSLYASFGDKRALYQHAISDCDREFISPGVAMLSDKTLSAKERLNAFFTSLVQAAETPQGRWGCLLCNAAIEQAPLNAEAEEVVSAALDRLRKAIRFCVTGTNASERVDLIWTSYFGGHVMVKAGYSKAVLEKIRTQILYLL